MGAVKVRNPADFERLRSCKSLTAQAGQHTSKSTMLCPNCKLREFPSIESLIMHLNSQSTCWPPEAQPQELPVPPVFHQSPVSSTTGACHQDSRYVFGIGKNMLDRLEDNTYAYRRKINHYYPFHDEGEWELGKFLVENLTQTQITKFLKLKWFNDHTRPSFTTKDKLLDWMDSLPCFTEWQVSKIEFSGYKTVYPIKLIWRNALDVVKQLFSDPIFANHMMFVPHHIGVGNQREYGDYMSADMAWKIQDHLPIGATQVPIILGSDKTPVTRLTEGLEMHLIFITIGNIDSEVRSKATLRAWRCIAYMPIVKFRVHPDYQSILQARLWHKFMDLVCANLKAAAAEGCFMPDPFRFICYVFTPLVVHVCDLPEATMIAATVDPWDLDKFQKVAKALNLSGVHMPYWRDWIYACPSIFLAGKILHTCFKFFADHPLKWVKETVGAYELDTHYIAQHKRVGTRHFAKGITHVKQMTGREYRDIQRTIVASIAGAVSPRFIRAICGLVDFTYLAQHPVHSPQSLQALTQALLDFHTFKDAIIAAEARKGKKGMKEDFFIPKLELMQSFEGTIRRLGTLMQFSADTTEQLLIMHYFTEQCIRILNRQESMEIFDLYALLTSWGASLVNAIHAEDEDFTITNPALSWVSRILPDEVKSVHGPRPVHNHFLKGILSGDALTAFQLNVTPDYKSLSPAEIRTKYTLPDFDHMLTDFIHRSSLASDEHTCWDPKYGHFQVWNRFRLQLHSAFQPRVIMPSRVVQAYPPSNDFPLGNCDTILIDGPGMDGNITSYVTQLPSYLSNPLLYVQYFHFVSHPEDHPELMMWTVERVYTHDANDATHAVELIPEYGEAVDKSMTSATCSESYEHFFLNNFADKESYHAFSTEFV
ncbi:uncharacterized protein F5891DRAFT_1130491 [Suillus fuscotomentosus]|uniref:DUF6830 domain-containing protein n=1 Tax=Suillus fuscotomentosus TaxID=1912939 RepID=A0AAD4DX94_9AGAM|nr:uncharacterized protein F5891DRAFT_1130491 [Suillus fuscotomentosus]KAG1895780.1 hypothetical protein F5891DRAFT_1130491 [Suillus fuscotomentosus]